jgi:iron complex transport system substrate-binding protein
VTGRAPALALGLALSIAVGRINPAAASGAVAVIHAGDTVRLPIPARRIVSLIPLTTEILVSAGPGDRVIARTRWCDWPPARWQTVNLSPLKDIP